MTDFCFKISIEMDEKQSMLYQHALQMRAPVVIFYNKDGLLFPFNITHAEVDVNENGDIRHTLTVDQSKFNQGAVAAMDFKYRSFPEIDTNENQIDKWEIK